MARMIDADIFIKDLTAMKRVYDAISLDGMIKALKEAPTIDPVKHGKWIIDRDCTHCSECRDVFGCTIMGYFTPKHCPSCGARMDGE